MAPKLLLDEHISSEVAHRLVALGFDVTSVRDRGLLSLKDWQLMEWCIGEGRAICTFNARDFLREHRKHLAAGRDHFGIILLTEATPDEVFALLARFLATTQDIELLNALADLREP